jgi:hypothetical protein
VPPALPSPAELLATGKLATLDAVAGAWESTVSGGTAHGCRALDLRVQGGIDVRVLPDRGFDVGAAWFRGVPLAWLSAVGERAPLDSPEGMAWLEGFGGGLVTTCGLRNVGVPSEGHGMHGRASHLRARDVAVSRALVDGEAVLTATAVIDEVDVFGAHLRLERMLRTRTGRGLVELEDRTTNLGTTEEAAPLLYHVNLGAPLLDADARVEVPEADAVPRDAVAREGLDAVTRPGSPVVGAEEVVVEHVYGDAGPPEGRAEVVNESLGLAVGVTWERGSLPRLWQWVHRRAGVYALGIEPANCSVLGRAADRAAGTLPLLAPGEERVTRLRIEARAV